MKNIKNLNQAKEQWASRHDKTWSDIQRDLEYGNGVSKIYSTEEVMDRVCEIYTNTETAALRKEVEELRVLCKKSNKHLGLLIAILDGNRDAKEDDLGHAIPEDKHVSDAKLFLYQSKNLLK